MNASEPISHEAFDRDRHDPALASDERIEQESTVMTPQNANHSRDQAGGDQGPQGLEAGDEGGQDVAAASAAEDGGQGHRADEGAQDGPERSELEPNEIDRLQDERDRLEARLIRVTADYQNYVRRSKQNATDACEQQLIALAKALLTPLDHFDHAMAVDPDKTAAQSLLQGVEIVHNELLKTLEQFGIQKMQVNVGDEFDPNRHEALVRQSVQGLDEGLVAQQLQPGYFLGNKVLRPAKVAVTE